MPNSSSIRHRWYIRHEIVVAIRFDLICQQCKFGKWYNNNMFSNYSLIYFSVMALDGKLLNVKTARFSACLMVEDRKSPGVW